MSDEINLLIVDDDMGDIELMKHAIRSHGVNANLHQAKTGEDGVELAKSIKNLIVVLDTRMPGMDGFETCKRIKEMDSDNTKVIICTGLIDAVDAGRARQMSADGYCVKTADYSELVDEIKTLVDV